MVKVYELISHIALVLAVISLITSVILAIKFNIVKLINDLSGRRARKSIEKMRNESDISYKMVKVYHGNDIPISVSGIMKDTAVIRDTYEMQDTDEMQVTDILPPTEKIQIGADAPENGMLEMVDSTEVLEPTEKLDEIQHTRVEKGTTVLQEDDDFRIIVNIL